MKSLQDEEAELLSDISSTIVKLKRISQKVERIQDAGEFHYPATQKSLDKLMEEIKLFMTEVNSKE